MKEKLEQIKAEAVAKIQEADVPEKLNDVRVKFLGKKGELTAVLKGMKDVAPEERPKVGQLVNDTRAAIEELLEESKAKMEKAIREEKMKAEVIDVTLPSKKNNVGHRHPNTIALEEVERIFVGMGYEVVEGPEVEYDLYNFEKLNIPADHPAKDEQDTFYINKDIVLRTQTSPVQARVMEQGKLPIRMIAPGRVFRSDEVDATHSPSFHQIEGLVIDKDISFADLKGTLEVFAKELFGPDTKTKFRPHHFPFTEPSAEVDVSCFKCGGKGCRFCKGSGWIEILGCGMIQYCGERSALLTFLSRFSYDTPEIAKLAPAHSGRALNRAYEEKLVGKVVFKVIRKCFLPPPLAAAYTVLKSIPYLVRGVRCLLQGKLRVELLDGLSIGISMARRDFSTAGSVMFLLSLGELLEEWTHKKSVDDLARCMSLNVDRVWLHTQEGEVLVPLNQIQPGDAISVRMGGLIPVDGMIVQGEVTVNQASLTGESVPVPKGPNTMVYAGTVVEEGECIIQVSQQNGSSRYDKIVSMIEQSEKLKSAAENKASHLADTLVPYTLLGSGLAYLLTRNVTRALSVLMVDFSCALKLAMPLAVLSATTCRTTSPARF